MSTISLPAPAGSRRFELRLIRAYEWLSHRELLACTVVMFLALGIRAALLFSVPAPQPNVEDEFSYLLAADTYSSGRLVNPPHPMWQHFETLHVLMQPVYASKYLPMQGLVLAFGQKLFGEPWVGVYVSSGLMCFFACWMLQGWLSQNAALLGAVLFMLRVGAFSSWTESYWGGIVPAIGGALVLGGLARVWRRGQAWHLATAAFGLAILMHSRPWEGAVLGAIVGCVLLWLWRRFPADLRAKCWRAAPAAIAILLVSLAAVGYVDYRVTGSPWTLPYSLYQQQYISTPNFLWEPIAPAPVYRHANIQALIEGWNADLRTARKDLVDVTLGKLFDLYDFFFGLWPFLVPPLIWPYRLKTLEERLTVVILVAFIVVANLPVVRYQNHYTAPIAALLFARFLQTLSRLYHWRPAGKPVGFAVSVFLVTLCVYQFAQYVGIFVHLKQMPDWVLSVKRTRIIRELERQPGKQLVLVHYSPNHDPNDEWIYNRADIDASRIVWAHEMGTVQDAPLLAYYPDRRAWVLDADANPPLLAPYPGKGAAAP